MALPKSKGGLALALGAMPSGDAGDGEDMDSGSTAAQSFLDAIASKDAAAVKSAFRDMYDECSAGHSDEFDA